MKLFRPKAEREADKAIFVKGLNEVVRKAALYDMQQMHVATAKDAVVEAVRQDLLNRSNVGIKKYGTTLADNSGDRRYWVNHAYEEALDLANYLKRLLMEIDNGN